MIRFRALNALLILGLPARSGNYSAYTDAQNDDKKYAPCAKKGFHNRYDTRRPSFLEGFYLIS
jgi:hypothetical protein